MERSDLDRSVAVLPQHVEVHGFLGDSILVDPFVIEPYVAALAAERIYIGQKVIPTTAAEYFSLYEKITGRAFDVALLSARCVRRLEAKVYASRWLHDLKFRRSCSHTPHLEFAIAVEDQLKVYMNAQTEKVEYYDETLGRWSPSGGQYHIAGEDLADPLVATFAPTRMSLCESSGKLKPVRGEFDKSCFLNASFTGPIACMVKSLKFEHTVPLDTTPGAEMRRVFEDGVTLDFGVAKPGALDWTDDAALECALNMPLRNATAQDRNTRFIRRPYTDYVSEHRLSLLKLINETCVYLDTEDVLSDDLKTKWDDELKHHEGLRRVLYEAHKDHDTFVYQMRIIFENAAAKTGGRMEYSTWRDDGDGSTGKGTARSWIEASCGIFDGKDSRGYVGILSVNTLMHRREGGEKPAEQLANLEGSIFGICDDFKATGRAPLDTALLRQLSGKNAVSAARKNKGERGFVVHGHIILMCNGMWVPDEPFMGSDDRRLAGLDFAVKFKNEPQGPNEVQKDATLKTRIGRLVPEFWFVARCFWLAATPKPLADQTAPVCANTLCLRAEVLAKPMGLTVTRAVVLEFIKERLTPFTLPSSTLPTSAKTIVETLMASTGALEAEARAGLAGVMQHKRGYHVRLQDPTGTRRGSQTVWMMLVDGAAVAMTLQVVVAAVVAAPV